MDAFVYKDTNIVQCVFFGAEVDEVPSSVIFVTGAPEDIEAGWIYDPSNKTFSKSNALKFDDIRAKRDQLLKDSDYTQLDDSTYPSTQDAWKTYRQELRDITKGVTDPDTIVFPEEPK
tara:strand:- start:160 stop:513 length:354 start_codon:yes stop_codon:yes gene_type:complete